MSCSSVPLPPAPLDDDVEPPNAASAAPALPPPPPPLHIGDDSDGDADESAPVMMDVLGGKHPYPNTLSITPPTVSTRDDPVTSRDGPTSSRPMLPPFFIAVQTPAGMRPPGKLAVIGDDDDDGGDGIAQEGTHTAQTKVDAVVPPGAMTDFMIEFNPSDSVQPSATNTPQVQSTTGESPKAVGPPRCIDDDDDSGPTPSVTAAAGRKELGQAAKRTLPLPIDAENDDDDQQPPERQVKASDDAGAPPPPPCDVATKSPHNRGDGVMAFEEDGADPAVLTSVFAARLPPYYGETQVREIFGRFGELEAVQVDHRLNIAFVNFTSTGAAAAAVRQLHDSNPSPRSPTRLFVILTSFPPPPETALEPNERVFIRGLPPYTSARNVRELCGRCGAVEEVMVLTHADGQCRGSALCKFHSLDGARRCVAELHRATVVIPTHHLGPGQQAHHHQAPVTSHLLVKFCEGMETRRARQQLISKRMEIAAGRVPALARTDSVVSIDHPPQTPPKSAPAAPAAKKAKATRRGNQHHHQQQQQQQHSAMPSGDIRHHQQQQHVQHQVPIEVLHAQALAREAALRQQLAEHEQRQLQPQQQQQQQQQQQVLPPSHHHQQPMVLVPASVSPATPPSLLPPPSQQQHQQPPPQPTTTYRQETIMTPQGPQLVLVPVQQQSQQQVVYASQPMTPPSAQPIPVQLQQNSLQPVMVLPGHTPGSTPLGLPPQGSNQSQRDATSPAEQPSSTFLRGDIHIRASGHEQAVVEIIKSVAPVSQLVSCGGNNGIVIRLANAAFDAPRVMDAITRIVLPNGERVIGQQL